AANQSRRQRPVAACANGFAILQSAQSLTAEFPRMAGDYETEQPEVQEGGPVKSFLEHLEDFRWVLIKSAVALGLAMLLCLVAGNYVIGVIKWPMTQAKISWPGTNQVAVVN